jgi:hypothetical protein
MGLSRTGLTEHGFCTISIWLNYSGTGFKQDALRSGVGLGYSVRLCLWATLRMPPLPEQVGQAGRQRWYQSDEQSPHENGPHGRQY